MRVLLLFRGSAGCGKSTYIEENGLKPYTLCADDIRLLCQSPVLKVNGERAISQANDKLTWSTLFKLLETRMQKGEFTVIDATNSKTEEMLRYKELAALYRYRIYLIDMTDIPIEEVKRRNKLRDAVKQVPDEVIDKFYARFAVQKVPTGITILKPDELDKIWYKPMDLSEYEKIHVIGDIHGCYTALNEYFTKYADIEAKNHYFVFCGDYIDRGIENAETLKFLMKISNYPNVTLLAGNHERWLWMWANSLNIGSKEFALYTKPQIEKVEIDKKDARMFYRKLCQCAYFTYNEKTFVVTHGGISNIPDNLTKISTEQLVRGVGKYEDSDDVDKAFYNNTEDNIYQIHGHRNISSSPIKTTPRTFNLENAVEFGGNLRAIQITKDSIIPIEIKNNVFKDPKAEPEFDFDKADMDVFNLVEKMRMDKNIYERGFGRISSFNFTREAFEHKAWSDIVNKARGLYIDVEEYKIVARSYNKFFNVNERPETKANNLRYKLEFPVTAYVKENGFLGIVSWNPETDDLLITTKSSITGVYSDYLKTMVEPYVTSEMKSYIKENNVSFIFECCDMKNDPHIIEYPQNKLVLLDIVKNQIDFEKLPYEELCVIGKCFGLPVKEKAYVLNTWEEFYDWYNEVTSEDYKYNNEYIEGFVIEDSAGFMTKLKLHYYKFWKHLRSVAHSVFKYGKYKYTGSLLTPYQNQFYDWCLKIRNELSLEDRKRTQTDICTLRKQFLEYMACNQNK